MRQLQTIRSISNNNIVDNDLHKSGLFLSKLGRFLGAEVYLVKYTRKNLYSRQYELPLLEERFFYFHTKENQFLNK